MKISFPQYLISACLLSASFVARVHASCSDGYVDGVLVEKDSGIYEGFFYPGWEELDALQVEAELIKDKLVFWSEGVTTEELITTELVTFYATAVDRLYQAEDDDGAAYGNTLDISAVYGTNATAFMDTCEELWACTQFYSQYMELASDIDYTTRALCFDDTYYYDMSDTDDDVKEIRLRENYIVTTCWGGSDDADDYNSLATLQETLTAVCGQAQELSSRLTFSIGAIEDTETQETCREAVSCIQTQTNDIIDALTDLGFIDADELESALSGDSSFDDLFDDDGELAFETCYNKTLEEITETLEECQTEGSSSCSDPPVYPSGKTPQCGASPDQGYLPQCPDNIYSMFEDFGPAYPTDELGYSVAVSSIEGTFIQCGSDDRTSADAVGVILFLKPIFRALLIIVEALKDSMPNDLPYIGFVPPVLIARIILQAFDIVTEQADYHDGLVQGAEIEALYENTRQMLNASSAIYDEVVCRCIDDLDTRPQRGHGCDSIDNNCDDVVDDCTEDNWKPTIDIGDTLIECSSPWFLSMDEAFSCVTGLATIEDDCDESLSLADSNFALTGTCYDSYYTITGEDKCGNEAESRTVPVLIDDADPVVTCGFDDGSGSFPTSISYESTGASVLEAVSLVYGATDNCNGNLEVGVEVYSNEIEDFHNQQLALLFQDDNPNDVVDLYIASGICSTSNNGQCIQEPNNEDIRLYTVVVTATDEAGRSSSSECTVLVYPQNGSPDEYDLSTSTQRFFLASYSADYDSTIDTFPSLSSSTESPTTTESPSAGSSTAAPTTCVATDETCSNNGDPCCDASASCSGGSGGLKCRI